MAASTRVYLVTGTDGATRLIKASVASQAITHAAKQSFTARVASQDDLIEELSKGTRVESYGETAQTELEV